MNASQIRQHFLDFFTNKGHKIVSSAPIILKNDPTLMFTNAGMNQFKDVFLGNAPPVYPRVANTQKCLRVSGKHNDLEEVGYDTYHHTMFEMLGNWSFGDYFKQEAIDWAWEFLTKEIGLDKELLYATVFEGDPSEGTGFDEEAFRCWKKHLPEERILCGSRKDNFWEMGDTGPCGPCSEIHMDLRSEKQRKEQPGYVLVNTGNPEVIEIWNLVFIQYNRKADGSLEPLPQKHVDTGMGFERLCRVVQGKSSNYDTDLFQPIIREIEKQSGMKYGTDLMTDVAMRVIADHLRALSFCIADGQLPSNIKAGYVLRRILRRAARYAYTFLKQDEPFIFQLVPVLADTMGDAFPELHIQKQLISKVIQEEEASFLRTLSTGIRLLQQIMETPLPSRQIPGDKAFELYDTYGFPLDLTELIAREKGFSVDKAGFDAAMKKQKERSRNAAVTHAGDWNIVFSTCEEGRFVGYDQLETPVKITRYRHVSVKGKDQIQLVLDVTPFYAESGGQIGDTGTLVSNHETIPILNTIKENNLNIHITDRLPRQPDAEFIAQVDSRSRLRTACNHSATHLLHFALRKILGSHVEQKGSLVEPARLRFDFSHFQKVSEEEIRQIEKLVNQLIRENIRREEIRSISLDEARKMGAIALFGEKYGEQVRVIRFGDSVELCGGTHVDSTASIGLFKIVSEGAIAAGIRRIEAVTGEEAEQYIYRQLDQLSAIRERLNHPKDPVLAIEQMLSELARLKRQNESCQAEQAAKIQQEIMNSAEYVNGVRVITRKIPAQSAEMLKDIVFPLKDTSENFVVLLGAAVEGKAHLALLITPDLVKSHNLHAGQIIRELAREIKGGGGGQPFFATAGGSDVEGLDRTFLKLKSILTK